ncbi:hypothetical protein MPTK1_7g14920 [Marchantia polymorpha subsp. ruderalis]|uniref:Uncharacterized protein n=2 Tax=Marchantia polymorpha TaxID=3197 RepID=A0AAF6BZQ2_MARPO|nr:hypothetical protein MARPO_0009s0177 [Marchantia polymorpha]BBN17486.1 hypothetical protein Mp_7g14920 [Marchantia polymorpha subsp. ruderalis]|eukprot:PTQ47092.1 hypothetical protein MARPO_0009s0177 [Marchantia polymorpha]
MVLKRNNSNLVLGAAVCFCVASAMSLLIGHVFISGAGSSICVPGLSIRCEPNDNGSQYVRCGRNQKVEDVPKGKMCYQGALISSDMRLRRSALIPSDCHKAKSLGGNSTKAFDLKSCSCSALCTGKNQCVCMCKSQAWTNVRCTNGKTYASVAHGDCCLGGAGRCKQFLDGSSDIWWSWWTENVDFASVLIRSSFRQICDYLRDHFTFRPSLDENSCCTRSSSSCNQC